MSQKINKQRRKFIQHLGMLTGGATLLATQTNLQLMKSALAANYSGLTDHKSLVCIFLAGGNDSFNMFIPYESAAHQNYQAIRKEMALPRANLNPVNGGSNYAFHPNMGGAITDLYNQNKLALISNVGTLIQPLTRAEYLAFRSGDQSIQVPRNLFSHNSQQEIWQTGHPPHTVNPTPAGWGGRMADLLDSANTAPHLSPSISLSGSNFWLPGNSTQPFSVAGSGLKNFTHLRNTPPHDDRSATWDRLLNLQRSNALEQQAAQSFTSMQDKRDDLENALLSAPAIQTVYPQTSLATSLKMIARLISIRDLLGMKRQIFFVKIGGWDTHDLQFKKHDILLSQVNDAMDAFYKTTEELNIANSVTSFTMSEFGRTSTSNGDGTDHAWGGHQLVMGGAVNGGQVFGTLPDITPGGPDDTSSTSGRIIPTLSVDQYGATLAKWMDMTDSDIDTIYPNLHRFAQHDLGFLT